MSNPARNTRVAPCPTCSKPVQWGPDATWRPFCSERCKLIDLGEWLGEEKRIVGEPVAREQQDYGE